MKTTLKLLISVVFSCGLMFSCSNETNEDTSLLDADLIISTYNNQSNEACSSAVDAILYPSPWTKEESEKFTKAETQLKNTSTYGLIQTYFNQPWNILGPWCSICSDLFMNGVNYFNNRVNQDKVMNELFTREDVLKKLIGRYVYIIQNLSSMEAHPGYLDSFEMLLASDQMNKILTDTASDELIVLALKMISLKKDNTEFKNNVASTRHIIANCLLRNQFTPFLSAYLKNGSLETNLYGYTVCNEDGKIEDYARMYLKTKN